MSNLLDAMHGGQTLEQRLTEEGRALKKIGKTKEQDMGHSKEPWQLERCTFFSNYGPQIGYFRHMSDEDARRIVACVNACAGFTTDELEDLNGTYESVLKQRNLLVEALLALTDKVDGRYVTAYLGEVDITDMVGEAFKAIYGDN